MRKLLLICIILLPALIKAQQYVPFPDSNVSWSEFYYGQAGPNLKYTYFIQGDTNINSQLYHKIYSNDSSSTFFYIGGLRKYNKKIYFIDKNCSHDILLYDFNLTIGDSIKSSCILCDTTLSLYMKVVTIDSVLLPDMTYRKRINFDWGSIYSWIEGIGSIFGLLYPENNCSTCICWTELVCFKHNDTTLYLHEDNVSCFDYVVSINELKKNQIYLMFIQIPLLIHL